MYNTRRYADGMNEPKPTVEEWESLYESVKVHKNTLFNAFHTAHGTVRTREEVEGNKLEEAKSAVNGA